MKKRLTFLIIIILLLFPISVLAADNPMVIECPSDSVGIGGTITCTVKAANYSTVTSADATVSVTGSVETFSVAKASIWSNGSDADNRLSVYGDTAINMPAEIGTVAITASSTANVGDTITIQLSNLAMNVDDSDFDFSTASTEVTKDLSVVEASESSTTVVEGESENPKTMDSNFIIISSMLVVTLLVVCVGKKKLSKISK